MNRRGFLAGVAGAAVRPSLAAATGFTAHEVAVARHMAAHDAMLAACRAYPDDEDVDRIAPYFDAESAALNNVARAPCANDAEFLKKLEYLLRRETACQGGGPDEGDPFATVLIAVQNRVMAG